MQCTTLSASLLTKVNIVNNHRRNLVNNNTHIQQVCTLAPIQQFLRHSKDSGTSDQDLFLRSPAVPPIPMNEPQSCRLCFVNGGVADVVMCFARTSDSSVAANEPPTKSETVAEILEIHFWFKLHSERDANAFVCRTCWTQVDQFHQFYKSVRAIYQSSQWPQLSPEKHLDECSGEYSVFASCDRPHNDVEDEDESMTHNENHHLTIKQEDVDAFDEDNADQPMYIKHEFVDIAAGDETNSTPDVDEPPKPRKRGRPPKNAESADSKLINPALLAKYFARRCDVCDASVSDLASAREHHQKVHKSRGYLACRLCAQRFYRVETMRDHCLFHEDASPHKCIDCCKIYMSESRLLSHRKFKHLCLAPGQEGDGADEASGARIGANKEIAVDGLTPEAKAEKTTKVPYSYNSLEQLRRDDELIRRFVPMICDLCGTAFETFGEAKQHHQLVHAQKGYVECCGKRFFIKNLAVQHCRWHLDPRQFDCTICNRNFCTMTSLRDHHIRRHQPDVPDAFQCGQCEHTFKLATQLRHHTRFVHMPVEQRRFECYRCHRRFVVMSKLRQHMLDGHNGGTGGPTHVCDVCARGFKSKATYELHYKLEHGTVSLKQQCAQCGKWLKHAHALVRHMAHHRMKPCSCDQCDYVAPTPRSLYCHKRRVHEAPKYACLVCEKKFKRMLTLREHMAIHEGIKDLYTCAYCPKTFRSMANMYKHRRQLHAEQYEADRRASKAADDLRNAEEAAAAWRVARAALEAS